MERITDIGTLLSRFEENEEETIVTRCETIRTLRRLSAGYNLLNRRIRMLKHTIQAMLSEDGVTLSSTDRFEYQKTLEEHEKERDAA